MKKLVLFVMMLLGLFSLFGCVKDIEFKGEYVVNIVDGEIIDGKEAMDSFYNQTKKGEKLKITINKSYSESESTYSNYIVYDGHYYRTDEKMLESSPKESKFKYLNYSETNGRGKNIVKTEAYCLSNDEYMTYERIVNSWFSSVMGEAIYDSIPVYCYNYYVDLCFEDNEVLSICTKDRRYPVNFFNKSTAIEIVDDLSWKKLDNKKIEFSSNLKIAMDRKILNDANNILIGKKGQTIPVIYMFDFENKIAIMHYANISSLTGALYAQLNDKNIEKIEELFSIFQGSSGTNWGEYVAAYNDNNVVFEINEDNTGKIYVVGSGVVEKIDNIVTFGDGELYLYSNNGYNQYVFTTNDGKKGGYTYVSTESNPSPLMKQYLINNMFFKWMGYPIY